MKIAYMFAGQGAQYPGMGADLYRKYDSAKDVFDRAGNELRSICFEGTPEELMKTENTQPCVYAATMAAYEAFQECSGGDFPPEAYAGFSLGEYSALTAAGVIRSIQDGTEILTLRGRFMAEAGADREGCPKGGMAAVIGSREKVMACIEETKNRINGRASSDSSPASANDAASHKNEKMILSAANFNAPMQTVVSGHKKAIEEFAALAKEQHLRVTVLNVGGAFHSAMMAPAGEKMRSLLENYDFGESRIPVYSNLTAAPIAEYRDGPAEALSRQLMSPVLWVDTIQRLLADGFDTFIEFGPGRTLTGLVKKIEKNVRTCHVENVVTLEQTLSELRGASRWK